MVHATCLLPRCLMGPIGYVVQQAPHVLSPTHSTHNIWVIVGAFCLSPLVHLSQASLELEAEGGALLVGLLALAKNIGPWLRGLNPRYIASGM